MAKQVSRADAFWKILVDGFSGNEVVIEELLIGPEISVLAFSDGYTIIPLPAAQDHKRIGEGDVGLNTGGMGAYAPAPIATPQVMERIMRESLQTTINGMRKEGPFSASVASVLQICTHQASRSLACSSPVSF